MLVVGSAGCGKTAFLQKYVGGQFPKEYIPTIGTEVYVRDEIFHNNNYSVIDRSNTTKRRTDGEEDDHITLELWNCSGQERFRPLIQLQYPLVKGVLLLYDMTQSASFKEDLLYWYRETQLEMPDAKLVIVGCKSDLSNQIVVTEQDG